MREGILAAVDAVNRQTASRQVNALGYCVGGTLLASTLAYMAAKGDDRYRVGDLPRRPGRFQRGWRPPRVHFDAQLSSLRRWFMAENGYLDGSRMAGRVQHAPPARPDLALRREQLSARQEALPLRSPVWNANLTRLPAANHAFIGASSIIVNRLSKGEMQLGGVPLDLSRVNIPIYELFTKEDHIAPALSVFRGGTSCSAVQCASSWRARAISLGVVNPPGKKKYQFWSGGVGDTLADWMASATETPGSWWPDLGRLAWRLIGEQDPCARSTSGAAQADRGCARGLWKSRD